MELAPEDILLADEPPVEAPPAEAATPAPAAAPRPPAPIPVPVVRPAAAKRPGAKGGEKPAEKTTWLRPLLAGAGGLAALAGLAVVALASGPERAAVFPARGEARFQGKAMPEAVVTFHPIGASVPGVPNPKGVVRPDGTFVVGTYAEDDGASPGEYGVTVHWHHKRKPDAEGPGASAIPSRYGNVKTSGLKAKIRAGENAVPPFDLGSANEAGPKRERPAKGAPAAAEASE